MESKAAASPMPFKPQRSEDFFSAYANNINLEASTWDLKIIFGQLDQATMSIEQHTSITLTWQMAKVAVHHIMSHIAAYETINGKIVLNKDVIPPEVQPIPEEQKNNPDFRNVHEVLKKLRDEFIKDNFAKE